MRKARKENRLIRNAVILMVSLMPLYAELPLQASNLASPAYWGMAHSGTALNTVRNAYWLNPALGSYDHPYVINLNEAFLPGKGISFTELSGHYILGKSMLQGGINYENYGSFDARDDEGIIRGTFTAAQYQCFAGYAQRITERFSAGIHLVLFGNRIDVSRENMLFIRYGFSYTFGKRDNMLAFSATTDGKSQRWRAAFSHELEYMPLRLNIDFRWYGDDYYPGIFLNETEYRFDFGAAARYFADKLALGAYIRVSEDLNLMAGFDLARLNMRTNAFGLDTMLSGLALGARYRFRQLEFNLAMYHYANFTTMSALGISYIGK